MNPDTNTYSIKIPTLETLEKMAIMEENIRQSPEYAEQCDLVKDIPDGWLNVTECVQKYVATFFGFTDAISNDIACNNLRLAHVNYPDNPVFKESLYVKHNKAVVGTLNSGDQIPNINLVTVDNKIVPLVSLIKTDQINIFFGGSHT